MRRVVIIGIGGCGSNVLRGLVNYGFAEDDLVVMNTDLNSLLAHPCRKKLLIPIMGDHPKKEISRFFLDPAHKMELETFVEDNDAGFLIAGLGGKTGTILIQQAADICRKMGLATVALGVKPFSFEDNIRSCEANEAIEVLKLVADVTIAVENDALFRTLPNTVTMGGAFGYLNEYISRLVAISVNVFTTKEKSDWADELNERYVRIAREGITISFREDFD